MAKSMPRMSPNIGGTLCLYQLHFNTGLSDATSRFCGEVSKEGAAFPPIAHRLDVSPSNLDEVTRLAMWRIIKKQRTRCDITAALLRQSVVRFRERRIPL